MSNISVVVATEVLFSDFFTRVSQHSLFIGQLVMIYSELQTTDMYGLLHINKSKTASIALCVVHGTKHCTGTERGREGLLQYTNEITSVQRKRTVPDTVHCTTKWTTKYYFIEKKVMFSSP